METFVLALSLCGLGLLLILMVHLSVNEYKRQKKLSDDVNYIRKAIENAEKENK